MRNIKINFIPKTNLGKWSVRLIITFFLFLISAMFIVASGQRGGDTFLSNLYISIPMFIAGFCGMAAFFTGIISIIKIKERSVFVFLSTAIGFLILFFVLGEFSVPH